MTETKLIAVAGTEVEDRLADVVFVHGLDGDPRLTWQIDDIEETFWPPLIRNDLPQIGVWSFGYEAPSSKWLGNAMPIVDRATSFAAFLRGERIGDRPVFFVAHSLGGLVVKQMLRARYDQNHEDPFVKNTQTVFYFATPHTGSPVAGYMKWLGLYRPSTIVEELEHANAPLRDINAWYRTNSARLGIKTVVFSETQKVKNAVLVVDQVASDPGLPGVVPIPIDCDHIEICKIDVESVAYKTIRNHLQDFVRNTAERISVVDSGPLWVDISCFNKYPDQWEERSTPKGASQVLMYGVERNAKRVRIAPDLPYLSSIRDQQPVWALPFMWMPFRWLPVTLDLKLLNRGPDPLYLTQLELHVDHSEMDKEPVLLVKRGSSFPFLYLHNDGWADIEHVTLRLGFADGKGVPEFPDDLPFAVELGEFENEGTEIDLSEFFAQLGVDVDAVLSYEKRAKLGLFECGRAYIYGEVTAEVRGLSSRLLRFGTEMMIKGPLFGMHGPPTFEYCAKLRTDAEHYIVPIEISQMIKPGESDRILVQLDVDKSSHHKLQLRFRGSGPDLAVETPVELSMFVPRSVAEHLRASEVEEQRFRE